MRFVTIRDLRSKSSQIQKQSVESGTGKISLEEINKIIAESRRNRNK